jgi:hypothetical protein
MRRTFSTNTAITTRSCYALRKFAPYQLLLVDTGCGQAEVVDFGAGNFCFEQVSETLGVSDRIARRE